jgi:hypothetical protein
MTLATGTKPEVVAQQGRGCDSEETKQRGLRTEEEEMKEAL